MVEQITETCERSAITDSYDGRGSAGSRPRMVDLEGSTSLAKRLSTPSSFALGRRLTRAADDASSTKDASPDAATPDTA